MTTKRKTVAVSKRTTSTDKLQAKLWREFLVASSVPWEEISEEWCEFFVAQGFIETAKDRLEELAKKAVGDVV